MGHFLALAGDVGLDKRLAAVGSQFDRAAVSRDEIAGAELLAVDEGEDEAIGHERAELLDEIEREAGTTGTVDVQEADVGIEPGGCQRRDAVVSHQGVSEGQATVEVVQGRPARSAVHGEFVAASGSNQPGEDAEVDTRGVAFVTAN